MTVQLFCFIGLAVAIGLSVVIGLTITLVARDTDRIANDSDGEWLS